MNKNIWYRLDELEPPKDIPVLVVTGEGVIAVAWWDSLTGWESKDIRIKWGSGLHWWSPLPKLPTMN